MIRIAIQAKGRLNEDSLKLLEDAGVSVASDKRRFIVKSSNFPVEVLFLRDDDIPQTVALGAADIGIVGLNEVLEREMDVEILQNLGFGSCRISLAVPKTENYTGLEWFNGKRVATSYPNILSKFFIEKGIDAQIHNIAGSVEISPSAGLADAIFDIVSSGSTLISNGLVEVEKVVYSEAVMIGTPGLSEEKMKLVDILKFRFESCLASRGKKYLLMNIQESKVEEAVRIVPAMRSPTVMPLAQKGWCSLHSVVNEYELWDKIDALREIGAEGILVLNVEKII